MITAPPDPAASLEAEQRSEDDGMTEHPQKAVDPAAWGEYRVDRETAAALGRSPRHRNSAIIPSRPESRLGMI
jgi:hypothetical protein